MNVFQNSDFNSREISSSCERYTVLLHKHLLPQSYLEISYSGPFSIQDLCKVVRSVDDSAYLFGKFARFAYNIRCTPVSFSGDSRLTAPPAEQTLPHEPLQRKGNTALQHLYVSRLSFFFVFFDFICWLAYTRHPRTLQPAVWPRSLCSFVFIVLGPNDTLINLLIVYVSSVFFLKTYPSELLLQDSRL